MANENRYYKKPFALGGNKAQVPDDSVDGAVGYNTGFGPDYALERGNENKKNIERDLFNGLNFGITKNLKQWQEGLYPTWIEDNGDGVAFSYPVGMVVAHSGQNWVSNEAANQEEPGAGAKWSVFSNELSFETFDLLQASTPVSAGQKLICNERANARYILQPAGYTALAGDPTFANGRVAALQGLNTSLTPLFRAEFFGVSESVDSTVAVQGAISRLATGGRLDLSSMIMINGTLSINSDNTTAAGTGRGTGFTTTSATGNLLQIESLDPTTTTIFRSGVSDLEIKSTVAKTSGALLKVTEAAYCTFFNISLQNGFIGFHGLGLRASEIDVIHIRSGQLYSTVKAGSRFMLLEDSPRVSSFSENVELFISNFNFTTNGTNAYIEYGLEVKEADGIWFDSGHVRGAALANGFINAGGTPQLLGLKFDNVWFDGATAKCLLLAGSPAGYAGFIKFNGCDFTGGSVNAVAMAAGAVFDWLEFNDSSTWSIDSQIAWDFQGTCKNLIIDGYTAKALNVSNNASASCLNIGAGVETFTLNGYHLFDSVNIDNAIVVNSAVLQATINGASFKGLPDASGNIVIQGASTIFNSSGCTTDQGHGYVTGNQQRGEILSVADDTAVNVNIGELTGATLSVGLKLNLLSHGLIALETEGTAATSIIAGGASLEVTTGVLSGTTGTDGVLTVSVSDAGILYFENRTGVTRSIVWKILNRDF
jgi:hypothetical protein